MLLSDETIWAIPDGASGIEFPDKEVCGYFIEQFNIEWDNAVEDLAKEHADCLRDNPSSVIEYDERVLVTFVPLDIPYMDDMYCDIDRGPEALDSAIRKTKQKYANAEFRGCIQYAWSDSNGGDVIKFDVSSTLINEPYGFVGDILKNAVNDEDEYFWEQIEDEDEIDGVLNDFKIYKDWVGEDAIERLTSIME